MIDNKRYYFVSFGGKSIINNKIYYWNKVIDMSPMDFLMGCRNSDEFFDFYLTSVLEITGDEYDRWKKVF